MQMQKHDPRDIHRDTQLNKMTLDQLLLILKSQRKLLMAAISLFYHRKDMAAGGKLL